MGKFFERFKCKLLRLRTIMFQFGSEKGPVRFETTRLSNPSMTV